MPHQGAIRVRTDARAVSEVVGIVLLFAIVALGAIAIMMASSTAAEQLNEQNDVHLMVDAVQELDTRLGTVAAGRGQQIRSIDLGSGVENVEVDTGDKLVLVANGNSECRAEIELDALRFEGQKRGEVVYQGGAVWQKTDSGYTALSSPDLSYKNDTLNLQVVTAANDPSLSDDVSVRKLEATSNTRTREVRNNLLSDRSCWRPEKMSVTVESDDYASMWANHFSKQFPDSADVSRSGDRVTVTLDGEELSPRVNDSVNAVVNFTDSNPANGAVYDANDTIRVDKGNDKTYRASFQFLGAQVGDNSTTYKTERIPHFENRTINTTNTSREVEMAFVVDDSGSMCGGKLSDAKSAAKAGVDEMNASRGDEVAAIGFDGSAHVAHAPPTSNYGAVKSGIDGLSCGGGTNIGNGIKLARNEVGSVGENTSGGMVVLTDGRGCGGCRRQARKAAAAGMKVYTIGVGRNVNTGLLQDLAHVTGGKYYHVSNAGGLEPVFEDIINHTRHTKINQTIEYKTKRVVKSRKIVHPPVQVGLEVGGEWRVPWVEEGSPLARQLNYPADPESVDGMRLEDGQEITVDNATAYKCQNSKWTGAVASPPSNPSKVFRQTKCVDVGSVLKRNTTAELYVDGQSVPSDDPVWWQTDTESVVDPFAVDTDGDGDPDEFDLKSNQVAVVVPMKDMGGVDANNVVFVADVGVANTDAKSQWLVNVRVAHVKINGD